MLTYVVSVIALSCQSSTNSTQHYTSVLNKAWQGSSYIQIQSSRLRIQFQINTQRVQICWILLKNFKYATYSTLAQVRLVCSWRKYLVGTHFLKNLVPLIALKRLIYCCLFSGWSIHLIPMSSFVELAS